MPQITNNMSFSWCLRYLFCTVCFLNVVRTVPPDYCLSPLNRSDCNMAPKKVFSYYKPGSRCELETWRGCPTANKFNNEYLCSLTCIFRNKQAQASDYKKHQLPAQVDQEIFDRLKTEPLQEINELLDLIIEEELTTTTEQDNETKSTTEAVAKSTTESTTKSATDSTTEFTTESTTEPSIESMIESESKIESTTESTNESTTESTIESTTESGTDSFEVFEAW